MASRFVRGSKAYSKDGRAYAVEAVEDGLVFCSLPNGAESEFPESSLLTEQEWAAQTDGRRDAAYSRLRQAPAYTARHPELDRAAAQRCLTQADRLIPGLLDYVAYRVGASALEDSQNDDLLAQLSIVKCRKIFDDASAENRAAALADLLGLRAEALIDAASLGDGMARAMIEKGMALHAEAFEEFCDRPRR